MRKVILCTLLAIAGMVGNAIAQYATGNGYSIRRDASKTESTFSIWNMQVNIRSTTTLKEGKMILELQNVGDYANFMNMDSLLQVFRKDIEFYKDSLQNNNGEHVRIDYVMSPEYSFKKIRFKKYQPEGEIFVNRSNDISRLKLDQDTINIIVEKILYKSKCNISYSVQATFILDNYTDVDKLIMNSDELHRIMETLEKESHSPKELKPGHYPEMTILYNPYYTGKYALRKFKSVGYENRNGMKFLGEHDKLTIHANIGDGLMMNALVPTAELGLAIVSPWGRGTSNFSFYRAYLSGHYFFDRSNDGPPSLKDNYFINMSLGSEYEKIQKREWVGYVTDFGIGYLLWSKGSLFKGTTMKVFTDIKIMTGLTLSPEIISTNNFRQFFPGITVKVF